MKRWHRCYFLIVLERPHTHVHIFLKIILLHIYVSCISTLEGKFRSNRSSKMHTEIIRPLKASSVIFLDGMGFNINSKILFHNIRSVIETSGVSLVVVVVYWITRKCIRNIIFAFRYLATVDGVLCTLLFFTFNIN